MIFSPWPLIVGGAGALNEKEARSVLTCSEILLLFFFFF